jgi:hypothetical protein
MSLYNSPVRGQEIDEYEYEDDNPIGSPIHSAPRYIEPRRITTPFSSAPTRITSPTRPAPRRLSPTRPAPRRLSPTRPAPRRFETDYSELEYTDANRPTSENNLPRVFINPNYILPSPNVYRAPNSYENQLQDEYERLREISIHRSETQLGTISRVIKRIHRGMQDTTDRVVIDHYENRLNELFDQMDILKNRIENLL